MASVRATRLRIEEFAVTIHNRDIERSFPEAEPPRETIGHIDKTRQFRLGCSPCLPTLVVPSQPMFAE